MGNLHVRHVTKSETSSQSQRAISLLNQSECLNTAWSPHCTNRRTVPYLLPTHTKMTQSEVNNFAMKRLYLIFVCLLIVCWFVSHWLGQYDPSKELSANGCCCIVANSEGDTCFRQRRKGKYTKNPVRNCVDYTKGGVLNAGAMNLARHLNEIKRGEGLYIILGTLSPVGNTVFPRLSALGAYFKCCGQGVRLNEGGRLIDWGGA